MINLLILKILNLISFYFYYRIYNNKKHKLMKELKTFFGDIDVSEVSNYLEHKMREINQEIPLKEE